MTRKKLLLPIFVALSAILFISLAKASTISVTCTPKVIPHSGGKTTITVTSDKGGIGSIMVVQPNGERSIVGIYIPLGGGSVSKVYPDDFVFSHLENPQIDFHEGNITILSLKEAERTKERMVLLLQALIEQPKSMHAGSTQQLGYYDVQVSLLGYVWFKSFTVIPAFFVIPESPIGTIMPILASLLALVGFIAAKHRVHRHMQNHILTSVRERSSSQ